MPNPPFTHATDDTVVGWNRVLAENPCARWAPTPDAVVHRLIAVASLSDAVIAAVLDKAAVDVGYYRNPKPRAKQC